MQNEDTIKLLKECNAGVKTGINSLREVDERVSLPEMKKEILASIETHEEIGEKTHELLIEHGEKGKEPSVMADVMSWLKINVKYTMEPTDSEIASLMIDGCNMGVKSLSEYLNQYKEADEKARKLVEDLIEAEKKLMEKLRTYL